MHWLHESSRNPRHLWRGGCQLDVTVNTLDFRGIGILYSNQSIKHLFRFISYDESNPHAVVDKKVSHRFKKPFALL